MLDLDNRDPERRSALSNLLRYAEDEARELNEATLAEKIRSAYLSMDGAAVTPVSAIHVPCRNKMRS